MRLARTRKLMGMQAFAQKEITESVQTRYSLKRPQKLMGTTNLQRKTRRLMGVLQCLFFLRKRLACHKENLCTYADLAILAYKHITTSVVCVYAGRKPYALIRRLMDPTPYGASEEDIVCNSVKRNTRYS